MPESDIRIHEATFSSRVSKWADSLFAQHLDWPFKRTEKGVEGFLASFFADFAAIVAGNQPDWGVPPDEFFIRAFESHISWPVKLTADFLWARAAAERSFDALLQEWQPLAQWITSQATGGAAVHIPERHASLPDSNDFLDATTVFFRQPHAGKVVSQPLHLPTRAHAEIVYLLSQHSIHGPLPLPTTEKAAQTLQEQVVKCITAIRAKAVELARSRTGDEKRAAD